jgi:signal transduction histidine kinase
VTDTKPVHASPSIARRLFIGAVVWSLAALIGGALALGAVYRAQTLRNLEETLEATLVELSRALTSVEVERDGVVVPDGRVATIDERLPADPRFAVQLSGWYWGVVALEPDGTKGREIRSASLWDGGAPVDERLFDAVIASPGTLLVGNAVGPADEPVRVAMRALRYENRATPLVLVAAADRSAADEQAGRFFWLLVGAMVVLAGGVLAAMAAQLHYGLAPLRRIARDVTQVREGTRQALDVDYPIEVQPLTEELNKLLEHNRKVVDRARTHVGNLAHALKTPIAVLMNEAKGKSPLEQLVRRQAEAMSGHVQHYLKRAQAAARAEVLGARCEVEPVVADLSRLLVRLFRDKGVNISTDVPGRTMFRGERQDLEEMLGNLMENACKWSASRVAVSARVEGAALVIRVEDDGPGLSEAEGATALKRGGRLDEAAPGTGLGLSIVTELVEMHHGALSLTRSALGGLCAEMRFAAA